MGYIVALTGGIGSGKSTVAHAFARLGITIIDADIIARQVVEPNTPALNAIEAHFGRRVIQADGTLNRRQLRECIFSVPAEKPGLMPCSTPLSTRKLSVRLPQPVRPMCCGWSRYWWKISFKIKQTERW